MKPKFSYPVCTGETRNKALAWSGNSAEIFSKLRKMGYDGVELFVRDPNEIDVPRLSRDLADNGLVVAAVGTGPIVAEDGLTLTHDDSAQRARALERGKSVLDFAAEMNTKMIIGKLRGDLKGREEKRQWRDAGMEALAAYADSKNVLFVLEPQSRIGCDNLNSTQDALAWLDQANAPNMKVMLDVFHMQIEDASIVASFVEAASKTVHIHFADTNRALPGGGGIDFLTILRVVKALGYNRFISMEINQTPDSETAARRSLEYMKMLSSFVW